MILLEPVRIRNTIIFRVQTRPRLTGFYLSVGLFISYDNCVVDHQFCRKVRDSKHRLDLVNSFWKMEDPRLVRNYSVMRDPLKKFQKFSKFPFKFLVHIGLVIFTSL
jgi:hypothetical protein